MVEYFNFQMIREKSHNKKNDTISVEISCSTFPSLSTDEVCDQRIYLHLIISGNTHMCIYENV